MLIYSSDLSGSQRDCAHEADRSRDHIRSPTVTPRCSRMIAPNAYQQRRHGTVGGCTTVLSCVLLSDHRGALTALLGLRSGRVPLQPARIQLRAGGRVAICIREGLAAGSRSAVPAAFLGTVRCNTAGDHIRAVIVCSEGARVRARHCAIHGGSVDQDAPVLATILLEAQERTLFGATGAEDVVGSAEGPEPPAGPGGPATPANKQTKPPSDWASTRAACSRRLALDSA